MKVDLDAVMLHVFHIHSKWSLKIVIESSIKWKALFKTHVAIVFLDVAFSSRNLECSMQYETYVAAFFLIIDGWIIKFYNIL